MTRLAALVVVAGSVAAINTWDVPAIWSIVVIAAGAAAAGSVPSALPEGDFARGEHSARAPGSAPPRLQLRAGIAAALVTAMALVVGTAILFLPYHLTASSQVRGIIPNLLHPTPPAQLLVMFATLAPGVLLLVAGSWDAGTARLRRALAVWLTLFGAVVVWLAAATAVATWGGGWDDWLTEALRGTPRSDLPRIALARWATGWPTLALVAAGLALTLEALRGRLVAAGRGRADGVAFALLLAAMGLGLVLLPEVLYLHDSFGTRMNTVFKFWYQAWLLLACAGALGIALAWQRVGRARAAAWVAIVMIAPGLFYPARALWTKTAGFAGEPTFDALAWLERWRPAEREAIEWVRRATPEDAIVVQRSGSSYRAEHNLVSMATGRATLLGWGGHEFQWRGESFGAFAAGREEALSRIYRPPSREELESALAQWNIGYVYIGPEERNRYAVSEADERILSEAMDIVFENSAVRILRRRR